MGVLGFNCVGVDDDCGGIGERELCTGSVHVVVAVDGSVGFVYDCVVLHVCSFVFMWG